MNLLLINGHPRKDSFTGALLASSLEGVKEAGYAVRVLHVRDLKFNLHVMHEHPIDQQLEPDILHAQADIFWANHIVFFYPTWWGTFPALLKGFIDRVFTSGFAFKEIEGGTGYEGLLKGKTSMLVTTMDTPVFVYKLIYRAPGNNAMAKALLGFCGIKVSRIMNFGPVKNSSIEKRKRWLNAVKSEMVKLKNGPYSPVKKLILTIGAWFKALRLQFYPMTFLAYMMGSYAANASGLSFNSTSFWLGYMWIFFTEMVTVFCNEWFDYRSDLINTRYSPFNGGSRVLVNGNLSFVQLRRGISLSIIAAIASFSLMCSFFIMGRETIIFSALLFIVATGYTVPPLKLSYRGLGELTVGITHSFAVIVCGFIYQGGNLFSSFPWLLGIPLFFSVLPSIAIAGIPDRDADAAVSKKTLTVRFGRRFTLVFAAATSIAALVSVILLQSFHHLNDLYKGILFFAVPHCVLLNWKLAVRQRQGNAATREDQLLMIALSYLIWFALIPLINLL